MIVYVAASYVLNTNDPEKAASAVERSLPSNGSMLIASVRIGPPAGKDNLWVDEGVELLQCKVLEFDVQG